MCHTVLPYKSKVCFELFCCVFMTCRLLLWLLWLFTTISFAALLFVLQLASRYTGHWTFISRSIQCTTQNDDNLIGLCMPFPFCAHLFLFFFFAAKLQSLPRAVATIWGVGGVREQLCAAECSPFSTVSTLTSDSIRHRNEFVFTIWLRDFCCLTGRAGSCALKISSFPALNAQCCGSLMLEF